MPLTREHRGRSVRKALEDVRRSGRSGRRGPVSVRFGPGVDSHLFAFAIGRRVGTAVVRNRVRRRMRAVAAGERHRLPAGTYLFSAGPDAVNLTFEEMRNAMIAALERATAEGAASHRVGVTP